MEHEEDSRRGFTGAGMHVKAAASVPQIEKPTGRIVSKLAAALGGVSKENELSSAGFSHGMHGQPRCNVNNASVGSNIKFQIGRIAVGSWLKDEPHANRCALALRLNVEARLDVLEELPSRQRVCRALFTLALRHLYHNLSNRPHASNIFVFVHLSGRRCCR